MIFLDVPPSAPVYLDGEQWLFLATALFCALFALGVSLGLKL